MGMFLCYKIDPCFWPASESHTTMSSLDRRAFRDLASTAIFIGIPDSFMSKMSPQEVMVFEITSPRKWIKMSEQKRAGHMRHAWVHNMISGELCKDDAKNFCKNKDGHISMSVVEREWSNFPDWYDIFKRSRKYECVDIDDDSVRCAIVKFQDMDGESHSLGIRYGFN